MYSATSVLQFVFISKASLPYSRTLISLSRLSDGSDLSMFIQDDFRDIIGKLAKLQRRKKYNDVSARILKEYIEFKVSSKFYQNLCSRKWLNSNLNLVGSFISTWSWMLKILFSLGVTKFSRPLRKQLLDRQMHLSGSSLRHTLKNSFGNTRSEK